MKRMTIRLFFPAAALAAVLCCGGEPAQSERVSEETGAPAVERRWEKLYGNTLFRMIEEKPLAWLPVGVLERHGEHLPWGLDGDKAHAVCLYLAERLGGVVMPANHYAGVHGDRGAGRSEEEFRRSHSRVGDFMFTESYYRDCLRQTFGSVANLGFEVIVAYTGHYPEVQTRILEETAREFSATGRAAVIPFWEPLACGEGDHAGRWESSIWLALGGEARLDSIVDYGTGRRGWYRGEEIRSEIDPGLGRRALAMIERYLSAEIGKAFSARR